MDLDSTKTWLDRLQAWDRIIGQNIRTQYLQGFINIVGKGLRETLVGKVKKEQAQIRNYLYEQTNQKAKDITSSIGQIKSTLAKPTHSLATFVEYVNSLKLCKN